MIRKRAFVKLIICFLASKAFGQNENYSFIPTSRLTITDNKTTNLIFPYSVQSIDRGSQDILVQQPRGTENIVQIKASKPNFLQTNLSVITIDGKLYSFTVDYSSQPSQLNVVIGKELPPVSDSNSKANVMLSSANNIALMEKVSAKVADLKAGLHGKKDKHDEMELQFGHLYINRDVLYFRLKLLNESNVSYEIDNIKFCIKDRQKAKRTASQEVEIKPLYTYGNFTSIPGNDSSLWVIALPKFTLPDSKYLSIQVLERNGGRDLHLALKNSSIMKAKVIADPN